MAIDFPALDDDELVQLMKDYLAFEAGQFGVTLDLDFGSDWDMWARLIASLQSSAQQQALSIMAAADPTRAFGAFLREHAYCRGIGHDFSLTSSDATTATGLVVIWCSGPSTVVPSNITLAAPDGQTFRTTAGATCPAATSLVNVGCRWSKDLRHFTIGYQSGAGITAGTVALNSVLWAIDAMNGASCVVSEYVSSAQYSQQDRVSFYNPLTFVPESMSLAYAVAVPCTALNAGRVGNRDPRAVLTVQSPPAGVIGAEVVYMDGGRDAMTPAQLKTQLRDLFATRQAQGLLPEIRSVALETPRVTLGDAFVQPGRSGVGTYAIRTMAAFGRAVSPATAFAVANYATNKLPRGLAIDAVQPVEIAADLTTVDVDCAVEYGPDFTVGTRQGYYSGTILSSFGGAAMIDCVDALSIPFTAVPRVGDRVIVSGGLALGAVTAHKRAFVVQRRVTSVGITSPTQFTLTVDGDINFIGYTVSVTAGGPLGQALIDALHDSYDSRAPNVPSSAPFVVHPDLEASTNQAALTIALKQVPGVVDVAVSADPAFTMDGSQVWQLGRTVIKMHAG